MKRMLTNHPLWKRGLAFFTAFAMLFAMMMPTAPVSRADGEQLAIATYTSAAGEVAEGSTDTNATYKGTWTASVPMGEVLSALENGIKTAADNGWYPHGKDGVYMIAYVEYTVTFPGGVAIDKDNIVTKNTTTIFNTNAFKFSVSGQTVTFKFPLQDQNWKGIYDLYVRDGGATSKKTIDFSIPYTVTATSKADAQNAENENIIAQGNFETHGSRRGYAITKKVYNTDTSSLPLATNFSTAPCFANAPGGNPNPQNPDPDQPKPDEPINPEKVEMNEPLDADLLLGTNTGNDVIEQENTAQMAFTGTLDVKPIKQQMIAIENAHKGAELDQIALSDLSSTFTATLTISTGLRFTKSTSASFKGGQNKDGKDIFKVTKTEVQDKTATVEFKLQDTDNIKSYADLKKAITSVEDLLKITFQAVEFDTSSKADTEYQVTGTVTGGMKATATYNQKAINFDLNWNGKQSKEGAYNNNQSQIKLVVKRTGPDIDDMGNEGILEGDLLINNDTQHDKVYLTGMDTPFTMTGLLNVKPIKDELSKLKAAYPQSVADKDIEVSKVATSFTATMTLPPELEFPADADKKATLEGANGKFKIQSAVVNGQTITVTMVPMLDLTKLTRPFEDISDTVQRVDDDLKVNVPGITVNSKKAKPNKLYTIQGTVKGDFSASATKKSSGKTIQFNYTWNGIQKKGGEDSTTPTTEEIKLTLTTADVSQSLDLCGDILVNGDTEHDAVYIAGQDATVPFTGKLNVTPVKDQLKTIEAQFNQNNIDPKDIDLTNYSSLFTATLTLPNEMDFVGTPTVSLKNDNGKYEIKDWKISGKTITVKMTVSADVKTFADLKDAVENMGDALEVVVNGAKFNNQAKANTPYTVYGTMYGELKAKATHMKSGTSLTFAFTWNAKQCKNGADCLYPDNANISFSLKWVKSTPPTPPNPPTPNPPTPNPPTPNPPTPNPPTPNPPTPNPPTPNPPTPNPPTPNPPTPNPPTPVEPNKPKPVEPTPSKPSAKTPTAPKTGDIASMLLCGGAFLLSSFGYAASKVKRGKRKHEE